MHDNGAANGTGDVGCDGVGACRSISISSDGPTILTVILK